MKELFGEQQSGGGVVTLVSNSHGEVLFLW